MDTQKPGWTPHVVYTTGPGCSKADLANPGLTRTLIRI